MNTFTHDRTTSEDGTAIGYRTLGDGPGMVVLHGAMESARSHLELAGALAGRFTVHLPDRRGRGRSGPYAPGDGLATEAADLAAVLAATGARRVMGVSSGALICLRAALDLPDIERVVAFEPPLPVDDSAPVGWVPRYEREMAAGRVAAALVTAMRATRMAPPLVTALPRPLLERMTSAMMRRGDPAGEDGDVPFADLAPTLRHDGRIVDEARELPPRLAGLRTPVLLLGGSRSPAYLRVALDALEATLPDQSRRELHGAGHGATGNANRGGRPEEAARVVAEFMA